MGFRNPIVGGTTLVRSAIKSPNYSAGSSGWTINADGTAEFNSMTIRGVFKGLEYIQNENGLFFYSSTPAFGTLSGSIAAAAGNDGFGNPYGAGVCVYDSSLTSSFVQMAQGVIGLGSYDKNTGLDTAGAAGINGKTSGKIKIASGAVGAFTDETFLILNAGEDGQGTGSGFRPYVSLGDGNGTSAVDFGISGSLVKTSVGGAFQTWQTPTFSSGWATGSSGSGAYPPLKWRYDAENRVHIHGTFHTTTTSHSTSVIASGLPGVNQSTLGGVGIAGAVVQFVGSSGSFAAYLNINGELRYTGVPTLAVGDSFMVNTLIPLGDLA